MKIILIGLVISTLTFGMRSFLNGDMGSGGGNAIVCFEKTTIAYGENTVNILDEIKKNKNIIPDKFLTHIKSIEMYDLYEAKKRRGIGSEPAEILKIEESENIYDYIDRLGARFQNTNHTVQGMIAQGKELLPDSRLIFEDTAVPYQNDLGTVSLPGKNCLISTMAAQVNNQNLFNAYIDRRLFEHAKHSKQSQATLILHEIIYASFRRHFKHTDSGATRNIVRLVISYHESITEKLVMDTLFDLKVFTHDDEPTLVNKYELSNSMYIVSAMTGYFVNEVKSTSIRDIDLEKLNLIKDYSIELANKDEIPLGLNQKKVFESTSMRINRGVLSGDSKLEWGELQAELAILTDSVVQNLNARIDDYVFSLKSELTDTLISETDKLNIINHIFSLLESGGLYKIDGFKAKAIDKILSLDENSFKNVLFSHMFYVTGCENEVCFDTLKLNNVVPRSF